MEIVLLLFIVLVPVLVAFFLSRGLYRGIRQHRDHSMALTVSILAFVAMMVLMGWGMLAWAASAFER